MVWKMVEEWIGNVFFFFAWRQYYRWGSWDRICVLCKLTPNELGENGMWSPKGPLFRLWPFGMEWAEWKRGTKQVVILGHEIYEVTWCIYFFNWQAKYVFQFLIINGIRKPTNINRSIISESRIRQISHSFWDICFSLMIEISEH